MVQTEHCVCGHFLHSTADFPSNDGKRRYCSARCRTKEEAIREDMEEQPDLFTVNGFHLPP